MRYKLVYLVCDEENNVVSNVEKSSMRKQPSSQNKIYPNLHLLELGLAYLNPF